MTAIELSSDAGLIAMGLLTLNILLGLLLSTRYNPVLQWPHKKIKIFEIHNWTGYIALGVAALHPLLLLASKTAGFKLVDIVWPLGSPGQRNSNVLGAIALYLLVFVVVTSYFRPQLGNKVWKKMHFAAYAVAFLFFSHGILIDPELKNQVIDPFDGEKILVELCALLVVVATAWRVRAGLKKT